MKIVCFKVAMSGLVTQVTLNQEEPINFDSSEVGGCDEISREVGLPGWEYNGNEELVGFVTLDEREAKLVAEAMQKASFYAMQQTMSRFLTAENGDVNDRPNVEVVS